MYKLDNRRYETNLLSCIVLFFFFEDFIIHTYYDVLKKKADLLVTLFVYKVFGPLQKNGLNNLLQYR